MNAEIFPAVEASVVAVSYLAGLAVSHVADRYKDNHTPAPISEWEVATSQTGDTTPRYTLLQKALGPVALITVFGASVVPAWVPLHNKVPHIGQPMLQEVVDAGGRTTQDNTASNIRAFTIDAAKTNRYTVNISVANQGGFTPNVSLQEYKLNAKSAQYPDGEYSPSDADSLSDATPPAISDAAHNVTPSKTGGLDPKTVETTAMLVITDDTELGPVGSISTVVDQAEANHVELFIANVGNNTDTNAADLRQEAAQTGGQYISVGNKPKAVVAAAAELVKELEPAKPAAEGQPSDLALKDLLYSMKFINILSLAGSIEAIRRAADWHMRKRSNESQGE